MRIALCGPAGSGKTTIAKMLVENYDFKRLSFATGVKRIATEFFGMVGKDRSLLQEIGETFRHIKPNVWLEYTLAEMSAYDNIVIDDVRYPNEYHMLKAEGFIVIKMVGRGYQMTKAQMEHESEIYWPTFNEDYIIDSSGDLLASMEQLELIVGKELLVKGVNMSGAYFTKTKEKSNKNYLRGRNFEYRVMKELRRYGFHVMRKFGSKDDIWKVNGEKIHVPVDLTAYHPSGVYLIISCKYSINGPTTWMVDKKWRNLVDYCELYGDRCLPIFAGVDQNRHVYFVDFRTKLPIDLDLLFVGGRIPKKKDIDEKSMKRLIDEAWETLDDIKAEIKSETDKDKLQKWLALKVNLMNIINRLLWRAGDTGGEEDLSKLFKKANEMFEEKKA